MGTAGTVAALRRVPGLEVKDFDSGCCGMAGSFGYEHGHYEVSVALANRVILPALKANPKARLVAPGFSCRSQVHGLAGHTPLHPIELLAEQLTPQESILRLGDRGCVRIPSKASGELKPPSYFTLQPDHAG